MLFLYGPPGSGKTTVGKKLAQSSHRTFIDIDSRIQERHLAIDEIILGKGVSYFREIEGNMLLELVESPEAQEAIISLGGGALLRRENMGFIQTGKGNIILLDGNPNTLYERVLGDKINIRPLMPTRESFLMLMDERHVHYSGFTKKVTVDDKTPEEIVDEIRSRFSIGISEDRSS